MWLTRILGKKGLIRDYIFVTVTTGIVMLILFLIINIMLWSSSIKNVKQACDVIFHQAEEQIAAYEDSIENLYSNMVYNRALLDYLQADSLAVRMDYLDDFYSLVASNRKINKNILNISLYNSDNELIASKGELFVLQENIPKDRRIQYMDRIIKNNVCYFPINMQVYVEVDKTYRHIGSINVLSDTGALEKILANSLVNEESGIALLDSAGNCIVSAGAWNDEYNTDDSKNIVYEKEFIRSQWKLISVVPEASLTRDVNQLLKSNYLIFGGCIMILFFFCLMIFKHVIQPIYRQTKFIESFKENTNQRIEVTEKNEIGKMSIALNKMLNDIEALNMKFMDAQRQNLELDYQKKQMEIIACKNQLNPHFLYNTFDCIRGIALYHNENEIARLIQSLSSLFRYSVKGEEWVTVREVIGQLEKYKTIIEYRFMGRYEILLECQEEIFNEKMPKMLIQPLIENAVLHGLEENPRGGEVKADFKMAGEGILICVGDNGIGMTTDKLENLRKKMEAYDTDCFISDAEYGIGLLNVYRRIRLLYGKDAGFRIESQANTGTKIEIFLRKRETG